MGHGRLPGLISTFTIVMAEHLLGRLLLLTPVSLLLNGFSMTTEESLEGGIGGQSADRRERRILMIQQ